jgi:hypothetical protein
VGSYPGAITCSGPATTTDGNPINYVAGNLTVTPATQFDVTYVVGPNGSGTSPVDGGQEPAAGFNLPTDTSVGFSANSGYQFEGWSTSSGCENVDVADLAGSRVVSLSCCSGPYIAAGGSSGPLSGPTTFTACYIASVTPPPPPPPPAPVLTVTPDSQTVVYGSPAPTYTFTVTGFVDGDTATTAAGYHAPVCTSSYTSTTDVGANPVITCSGGSATDYTFLYKTAIVTITPATPTVTITNMPVSGTVGGGFTAIPATSGNGTAFTITSTNTAACTVNGFAVSFVGDGTCSLIVTVAATTDWTTASSTLTTLTSSATKPPKKKVPPYKIPTSAPQTGAGGAAGVTFNGGLLSIGSLMILAGLAAMALTRRRRNA